MQSGPVSEELLIKVTPPEPRGALVENGVLRSFLTDLRTAAKLDLPATGNGLKLKRLIQTKDLGKMPASEITNWEMAGGMRPTPSCWPGSATV